MQMQYFFGHIVARYCMHIRTHEQGGTLIIVTNFKQCHTRATLTSHSLCGKQSVRVIRKSSISPGYEPQLGEKQRKQQEDSELKRQGK